MVRSRGNALAPAIAAGEDGGEEDGDRTRMVETAPGPVDCLLDLLPPAASPPTVRPNGRVVLMGVSNRGVDPVSWMSIGRLVGSSLAFKRDGCQREAIGHAAANAGPFEVAVIYPQQEKNRTVAAALPLVTGKRAP